MHMNSASCYGICTMQIEIHFPCNPKNWTPNSSVVASFPSHGHSGYSIRVEVLPRAVFRSLKHFTSSNARLQFWPCQVHAVYMQDCIHTSTTWRVTSVQWQSWWWRVVQLSPVSHSPTSPFRPYSFPWLVIPPTSPFCLYGSLVGHSPNISLLCSLCLSTVMYVT